MAAKRGGDSLLFCGVKMISPVRVNLFARIVGAVYTAFFRLLWVDGLSMSGSNVTFSNY